MTQAEVTLVSAKAAYEKSEVELDRAIGLLLDHAGIVIAEFPFIRSGSIVHLGRGTLRAVVQNKDRSNRYFAWATDHHDPHFTLEAAAPELYEKFLDEFRSDVGDVSAASLIRACAKYR